MTDDRYRDRQDPDFDHNAAQYRDDQRDAQYRPREHTGQYKTEDARPRYREHPSDRAPDRTRERHHHNGSGSGNTRRNIYNGQQQAVTYPVEFHGRTSEYFKIWIVNIFLTIITLYIYSAWAKVRTKRYFYGNTSIDGSTFEFHATGGQLVVGRLIAAALLITYTFSQGISPTLSLVALATIVLMFPWAIWRSLKFNARASSFRNIRFAFDGTAGVPYFNFLIIPLIVLAVLSAAGYLLYLEFGHLTSDDLATAPPQTVAIAGAAILIIFLFIMSIIVPFIHRNMISYSHNNHRYGTAKFAAEIKTGRIFGIHFVTLLLSILTVVLVGGIFYGAYQLITSTPSLIENMEHLDPYMEEIASVAIYLILIPASGFAVAYFKSSIRNHRYNATKIDSRVRLNSSTGTWSLWWLSFSNLMLLILTIGFAYPYTKIRTARYFARRTSITVTGGLESFTENEKSKLSVMGEEMADAFDVDFDIGV